MSRDSAETELFFSLGEADSAVHLQNPIVDGFTRENVAGREGTVEEAIGTAKRAVSSWVANASSGFVFPDSSMETGFLLFYLRDRRTPLVIIGMCTVVSIFAQVVAASLRTDIAATSVGIFSGFLWVVSFLLLLAQFYLRGGSAPAASSGVPATSREITNDSQVINPQSIAAAHTQENILLLCNACVYVTAFSMYLLKSSCPLEDASRCLHMFEAEGLIALTVVFSTTICKLRFWLQAAHSVVCCGTLLTLRALVPTSVGHPDKKFLIETSVAIAVVVALSVATTWFIDRGERVHFLQLRDLSLQAEDARKLQLMATTVAAITIPSTLVSRIARGESIHDIFPGAGVCLTAIRDLERRALENQWAPHDIAVFLQHLHLQQDAAVAWYERRLQRAAGMTSDGEDATLASGLYRLTKVHKFGDQHMVIFHPGVAASPATAATTTTGESPPSLECLAQSLAQFLQISLVKLLVDRNENITPIEKCIWCSALSISVSEGVAELLSVQQRYFVAVGSAVDSAEQQLRSLLTDSQRRPLPVPGAPVVVLKQSLIDRFAGLQLGWKPVASLSWTDSQGYRASSHCFDLFGWVRQQVPVARSPSTVPLDCCALEHTPVRLQKSTASLVNVIVMCDEHCRKASQSLSDSQPHIPSGASGSSLGASLELELIAFSRRTSEDRVSSATNPLAGRPVPSPQQETVPTASIILGNDVFEGWMLARRFADPTIEVAYATVVATTDERLRRRWQGFCMTVVALTILSLAITESLWDIGHRAKNPFLWTFITVAAGSVALASTYFDSEDIGLIVGRVAEACYAASYAIMFVLARSGDGFLSQSNMFWFVVLMSLTVLRERRLGLAFHVVLPPLLFVPFLLNTLQFQRGTIRSSLVFALSFVGFGCSVMFVLWDRSRREQFLTSYRLDEVQKILCKDAAAIGVLLESVMPNEIAGDLVRRVRAQVIQNSDDVLHLSLSRVQRQSVPNYSTRLDVPAHQGMWQSPFTSFTQDQNVLLIRLDSPSVRSASMAAVLPPLVEQITREIAPFESVFLAKVTERYIMIADRRNALCCRASEILRAAAAVYHVLTSFPLPLVFSCAVGIGPSIGAVLGSTQISFDIFGHSVLTLRALVDHASPGEVVATDRFFWYACSSFETRVLALLSLSERASNIEGVRSDEGADRATVRWTENITAVLASARWKMRDVGSVLVHTVLIQ